MLADDGEVRLHTHTVKNAHKRGHKIKGEGVWQFAHAARSAGMQTPSNRCLSLNDLDGYSNIKLS